MDRWGWPDCMLSEKRGVEWWGLGFKPYCTDKERIMIMVVEGGGVVFY